MKFTNPFVLILLLLVPVLYWHGVSRRSQPSVRFSTSELPAAAGQSFRQKWRHAPLILRLAALSLLIVALARPQEGLETVRDVSRGIAIEMVLDHSGSMRAEMEMGGRRLTRLDAVKEVFSEFVFGNKAGLAGRSNDLIGMIIFARYADTICPLTLAHDTMRYFLGNVGIVERREEDGTAIGDALALAAARLRTAEETLRRQGREREKSYELKNKVIILLTDGENNMGSISPAEAAEMAREWGIKIYAIGVGGDEIIQVPTFLGPQFFRTGRGVDKKTLQEIADRTGGKFWLAEDGKALRQVYEEIDALEKSEVESIRYVDYKESFMPFAVAGLLALVLEAALGATIFRRLP